MSTRYIHTLTAFCPDALWADGNHLAACMGESGPSDLQTFTAASFVHGDIEQAMISTGVTETVRQALLAAQADNDPNREVDEDGKPIEPDRFDPPSPAWDKNGVVSKEAARRSLEGAVIVVDLEYDEDGAPVLPEWDGTTMLLALNVDWQALVAAYGAARAQEEQGEYSH